MHLFYLAIVFLIIIVLLAVKRPLWQAICGALLVSAVFFRIDPISALRLAIRVFTTWSSLSVLLALYLITLLQRVLEARNRVKLAQEKLDTMYRSKKITIIGSCLFIGLLPSAAAMVLCGQIVREATAETELNETDKAFLSSWFRHIPESSLPTYSSVLLMMNFSNVSLASFMPAMIVPVIVLALLGDLAALRKIPATKAESSDGAKHARVTLQDWAELLGYVWPLILIIALILITGLDVVFAVLIAIMVCLPVFRIRPKECGSMLISAIDKKMLINTYLVLVLKEFIAASGVLTLIPNALNRLPLPPAILFAILFFLLTAIGGAAAAIAMGMPIVMAAMPAAMPLMVYLMSAVHAGSQVSPTHICLVVAADYFGVSLGSVIKKTLPYALLFLILMTLYYGALTLLF